MVKRTKIPADRSNKFIANFILSRPDGMARFIVLGFKRSISESNIRLASIAKVLAVIMHPSRRQVQLIKYDELEIQEFSPSRAFKAIPDPNKANGRANKRV